MRQAGAALAALLLFPAAGCATRDGFPGPTGILAADPDAAAAGYLDPVAVARIARSLPPPPPPGSPEDVADRLASNQLRALEGGDRWLLAGLHAELSPALAAQQFSCALGFRLAETDTPVLRRTLARALADARAAAAQVRDRSRRARPIQDDPSRRPCIRLPRSTQLGTAHPSTAAAAGRLYGRILAAAAPDRAGAVTRIGHEIGVSRAVCGLDYPADVVAGQTLGDALFEAMRTAPTFQADLVGVRAELDRARAAGDRHPGCAAERSALGPDRP